MSTHVTKICKSASFALWRMSRIITLFDQSSTLILIHAIVASRMDYCNGLLFGLPSHEIIKIQIIHISAARLVTKTGKHDDISPYCMGYTGFRCTTALSSDLYVQLIKLLMVLHILEQAAEYLYST